MDNNEAHKKAFLYQGNMKDINIRYWLKMDNPEGSIDIELDRIYNINLTEDMNELDIMDMNLAMLTKMFKQTRMTEDINEQDDWETGNDTKVEGDNTQGIDISTVVNVSDTNEHNQEVHEVQEAHKVNEVQV